MLFKLIPDISVRELFSSFDHALDLVNYIMFLVSCSCCIMILVDFLLKVLLQLLEFMKRWNTVDTTPTTRHAGPNQRLTTNNQSNKSAISENGNSTDHRTLWLSLGFTDEIDRRDFGRHWNEVEKLKYNNPTLISLRSIVPRKLGQSSRKHAWIRLGWYAAKNEFIQEVDYHGCDYMTDEVVQFMFGSVIWTPKERIKCMDFSDCSITSDGIKSLIPFVKAAPSITAFWIHGSIIGTEGFDLVAAALSGAKIEILSFNYCAINDIVPTLTHCIFPELKIFYFFGNQIDAEGMEVIADKFLRSSPKLLKLGLSDCGISDQGAQVIANALVSNTTLKKLRLQANSISIEGLELFAKALRSNHTLLELTLTHRTGWSDSLTHYRDLQFALEMNNIFEKDLKKAQRAKEKYFAKDGDGLECTVCLQNKSEFFFFLPCGHKLCTDCNDLYDKDICHLCKTEIEKRQRLY